MIDNDLSQQLHSLASTVSEPIDLVALHRRISVQSRRRAAVKVGFAGAGVAAVVGGLFVVRDERSGPAGGGLAAASSVTATGSQTQPTLTDCAVALAELQAANSTDAAIAPKGTSPDPSATPSDLPEADFKGVVTILTIDGSQITFSNDDPKAPIPTSGVAIVDAATDWNDGSTHLDAAPTMQVGQHVGLATTAGTDGVDHVIFIDIAAPQSVQPAPTPDVKIIVPGPSLPPGPTDKSRGTITGVVANSISVILDDGSEQGRTLSIDLASTPFYAVDAKCTPGSLTVGAPLGVAYHYDDANAVVSDAVMVMPSS